MKIGRNFKSNSSEMLLHTIENMLLNEGNLGVEELSDRYVRNELVSRPEIKNVKVAASKMLWLYVISHLPKEDPINVKMNIE